MLVLLIILVACSMYAQNAPGNYVIQGTVQDQTNAVIAGASVQLLDAQGSVIAAANSDTSGAFRLEHLIKGAYRIKVYREGFSPTELPVVPGASMLASVHVVLPIASTNIDVTVDSGSSTAQVNTEISQNQSANTLERTALDRLPVFDADYLATVSRFLDVDATGTNGVPLVVNGMEANGPGVSASAIKSVKINQNPYSALFARPGRARIEIDTEPGTPRFHGASNFLFRDALFDARNSFAAVRPPENKTYFEGSLTGPLGDGKKNTFLLSGQDDNDNQEAVVVAEGPGGPVNVNVANPTNHYFLSGRAFHNIGESKQLWMSYSYENESTRNRGVGGIVLPEAGTNVTSFEHEINVGYSTVVTRRLLNQLHFLVGHNDEKTLSRSIAPGIVVSGAFTGGGAQADRRRTETHFDGTDLVTYGGGKQEIKFGIDVPDISRRGLDDYTNRLGTYSFASLSDYAAAKPYSYVVQQGQGRVTFLEVVLAGFFEDNIRIRPNFSLAVGARYYWQNYFHDVARDIAPRMSFAFAPAVTSRTIIRGGAGLFYDRSGPAPIGDVLHFDGIHLKRFIAADPSYPITPAEVAALPPGIVQVDQRLRIPSRLQYSVGIERQVTARSTMAANYTGSRGMNLFRSVDVNAPRPASGYSSRPNPDFGQIRQIESEGYLRGNSLEVTFRGKPVTFFNGQIQYTLGKTYTNTSGVAYFPANSNYPNAEWGRSDNDRRHKFDLLGTFKASHYFDLGIALSLYSGKPVNITTGNDDYHDGLGLARPAGVPRNSLHGPGYQNLDLNVSRDITFRKPREGAPMLTVSLSSFNLLNHVNDVTYVGSQSSPFFGRAVQALPPRRTQLSITYKF